MERITAAVLFGGRGEEHAVSCHTAANLLRHTADAGIVALPVAITREGEFRLCPRDYDPLRLLTDPSAGEGAPTFPVRLAGRAGFLTEGGGVLPVDTVLPALHGDAGEDGILQGLLCAAGLPYIGSDTHAGALCADKAATKRLAADLGIPTLPFCVLTPGTPPEDIRRQIVARFGASPYPLFVKPVGLGSSVGTALARDESDLLAACFAAYRWGDVLVEPYLHPVEEFEVAWLDAPGTCFGPGRIVTTEGFYDFDKKYVGAGARAEDDPAVTPELRETLFAAARRLIRAAGVRDLCRVDFFRAGGKLYFNEINTFPGLTETSLYPALLARGGIPFSGFLRHLAALSCARRV